MLGFLSADMRCRFLPLKYASMANPSWIRTYIRQHPGSIYNTRTPTNDGKFLYLNQAHICKRIHEVRLKIRIGLRSTDAYPFTSSFHADRSTIGLKCLDTSPWSTNFRDDYRTNKFDGSVHRRLCGCNSALTSARKSTEEQPATTRLRV